ncbi:MAG TPA: hypothetical protein DER64_12600 [Planctomycetaceae bacterium]|nr:hypothetical protein [Planctomycetaceae bacterium]
MTRRAIRLGVCLVLGLSVSASTADAGVIPWLIDSLFGPQGGRCQPTYGSYGANAAYGGYAVNGCPPASYGYMAPQRIYSQPAAAAPYYGNAYGSSYGYGSPCMPRLPNLIPALFGGIFGCRPGYSPYGGRWGCSPCGYGGCPITLPAGSASTGGWQKSQAAPRTFATDPQAAGEGQTDTRTFRPPIDTDADPGQVIPKIQKPAEKKPVEKKPVEKKTSMVSGKDVGIVHHVVPSRARIARRASTAARRLGSVVVARRVIDIQPSLRPALPGSTIAGR